MMIQEKYKPYPIYKSSGVDWIAGIPEGWETRRVKRLFKIVNGSTPESNVEEYWDGPIVWITPDDLGDLATKEISDSLRKITIEGYNSCGTTITKEQSIVISTRAPIGHAGLATIHTCTNQGCKTLEPKTILDSTYYYYCVIAGKVELISFGNGSTYLELSKTKLGYIILPLPPFTEQRAIADFLDRETLRINGIVEKQTRKIKLLKEKRSALITHAVTKGLDSKAKMKDSGVEWIGEIPEGWEVRRLRFSVKYNLETLSENTTNPNYEIEYLDISNVDGDGNIISTETLLFGDAPSRARRVVKNGNTIISTVRTYLKAIAYLDEIPNNLIVSTGFAVIESVELTNSKYLFYFIRSEYFVQNVTKNSKGVSYPAITPSQSPSNLIDILILVPPLPEQQVIANFLDRETVRIDTLIGKIEKQIELLNEYKQSLITDAVTGKIDVRGEAYAQNS